MPRRVRADAVEDQDDYRPLPRRRRWLVAALAVATAVTLITMMLERIGAPEIARPPAAAGPARCAQGQVSGCLGGKADVIVVPAASAASAAAALSAGKGS
jgi:hypothetical protein